MIDQEGFNQMIDEIMAQGYDLETACKFAAIIGDTPELDRDDNLVVRDKSGNLLATLRPLDCFGD